MVFERTTLINCYVHNKYLCPSLCLFLHYLIVSTCHYHIRLLLLVRIFFLTYICIDVHSEHISFFSLTGSGLQYKTPTLILCMIIVNCIPLLCLFLQCSYNWLDYHTTFYHMSYCISLDCYFTYALPVNVMLLFPQWLFYFVCYFLPSF